jgi:hypothetical protein
MDRGHEITVITCRGCGRKVEHVNAGNTFVGCQNRLRCTACGHRGADILRVFSQNPAPKKP